MSNTRKVLFATSVVVVTLVVILSGLPYDKLSWKALAQTYSYGPLPVTESIEVNTPSDLLPNERRIDGGKCKLFNVTIGGVNFIQVYSGFEDAPPNGVLVAQLPTDSAHSGESYQADGLAEELGWNIVVGANRTFNVVDNGNVVCANVTY